MINALYTELTVAAVGTDCQATAAWLQADLRHYHPVQAMRAEAFWQAADESLQHSLGARIGLCEKGADDAPVHDAIVRDFDTLLGAATTRLDFAV